MSNSRFSAATRRLSRAFHTPHADESRDQQAVRPRVAHDSEVFVYAYVPAGVGEVLRMYRSGDRPPLVRRELRAFSENASPRALKDNPARRLLGRQ